MKESGAGLQDLFPARVDTGVRSLILPEPDVNRTGLRLYGSRPVMDQLCPRMVLTLSTAVSTRFKSLSRPF